MRRKVFIFVLISILSACLAGCSYVSIFENEPAIEASTLTPEDAKKEENDIPGNTSEPFIGRKALDSETEKFFYGTWSVEKLLGFADSYNDASEYPAGQKIIGNQIVIDKNFFSSKGFEDYKTYQFELDKPIYDIEEIHYNADSFYRVDKIDMPSLNMNDEVKVLGVSDSSTGLAIPVSFLDVNNDRLLLVLEATVFELKRVTE
ncbi:hypothetical protein [Petroclostridium sp. X23]|uniref:hypothetical protein n=1 Tax=Petroclostridium sp. X23 TaxID=3045146 RepID=UPI0024AE0F9F|nr:hypothetical protein [Petroclostridium sp. X23]WHH58562.1 hypothetical protein QKW49_22645 [Petroclostridium sp. X23]